MTVGDADAGSDQFQRIDAGSQRGLAVGGIEQREQTAATGIAKQLDRQQQLTGLNSQQIDQVGLTTDRGNRTEQGRQRADPGIASRGAGLNDGFDGADIGRQRYLKSECGQQPAGTDADIGQTAVADGAGVDIGAEYGEQTGYHAAVDLQQSGADRKYRIRCRYCHLGDGRGVDLTCHPDTEEAAIALRQGDADGIRHRLAGGRDAAGIDRIVGRRGIYQWIPAPAMGHRGAAEFVGLHGIAGGYRECLGAGIAGHHLADLLSAGQRRHICRLLQFPFLVKQIADIDRGQQDHCQRQKDCRHQYQRTTLPLMPAAPGVRHAGEHD